MFIKKLSIVGTTTTKFSKKDLPLRLHPIYSNGERFFEPIKEDPYFEEDFESLTKEELDERGFIRFAFPIKASQFDCLLQMQQDQDPVVKCIKTAVRGFLIAAGEQAMMLAAKAIIADNESEAEEHLWYAARCFPKENVAAILALRLLLKGKISSEELMVLDRHLIEDEKDD